MLTEALHPNKTPERLYENSLYGISRFLFVHKSYSLMQSLLQRIANSLYPKCGLNQAFRGLMPLDVFRNL
jgi:hypothetical protein